MLISPLAWNKPFLVRLQIFFSWYTECLTESWIWKQEDSTLLSVTVAEETEANKIKSHNWYVSGTGFELMNLSLTNSKPNAKLDIPKED
ncbi:uncharacterized protein ACOB8E_011568 isoform 2-T2 [Sarcophilus harrisii]